VDDIVGRLTKVLDTLHIADNTLVVFLSDNGPEEDSFPDSGHTPFRGAKGTTLEGGVRIPAIFRWPNMIAAGRVSDGLFDVTDMFNTSLRIAGIDAIQAVPKDRYIDGIDQSGFLLTDAGQTAREAVYMYNWDQFMAVRWGQYKMSISEVQIGNDNVRAIGGLDNGLIVTPNTATLYNLYIDPKERRNVLTQKAWVAAYAFTPLLTLHGATMAKYPTVTKVRYR
jgi:arylsulfatase